ncbi:MAG: YeeE/YedE family protein [Flavisolibacter sp.]
MLSVFRQHWPWYVSGPLIGLMVPLLLILGNKAFGLSSSLRHICAACFPAQISFFRYDWKKEAWNLFLVAGIVVGAFLTWKFLFNYQDMNLNPKLLQELNSYGISDHRQIVPHEVVSWQGLFTWKGFVMIVVGGFLVGFGTRYAGGCTSGHSISGLSNLQWPSLVATICFMAGGFLVSNLILPLILK